MGYTRCPAYLLNTSNSFCSTSRLRCSRSFGGENGGEIFDGDCPLSHNSSFNFTTSFFFRLLFGNTISIQIDIALGLSYNNHTNNYYCIAWEVVYEFFCISNAVG